MAEVIWNKGKLKTIFTKEEKKEQWKQAWKYCYKSKIFWLAMLLSFCISFGTNILIRIIRGV